jgi:NADH pyrophosphatase NudC (nudix superfamily)
VSRFDVYSIFFSATIVGGEINPCHEILEVKWFDINDLPELSRKLAKEELVKAFEIHKNREETYFD